MMIALLEEDLRDELGDAGEKDQDTEEREAEEEWVEVMKKHRVQASRLELLASGVGSGVGRVASPVDRGGSPGR